MVDSKETIPNSDQKLTDKERKELESMLPNRLCVCGHPRKSHSRYVFGMFQGCQQVNLTNYKTCSCDRYVWDGKS